MKWKLATFAVNVVLLLTTITAIILAMSYGL
jgi:hypothetical protein